MPLAREDIVEMFFWVFGREPESEDIIRIYAATHADLRALRMTALRSEEFQSGLATMQLPDPADGGDEASPSAVSRADVVAMYRWILGREPESDAVIAHHRAVHDSIDDLRMTGIRSSEFQRALAALRTDFAPPGESASAPEAHPAPAADTPGVGSAPVIRSSPPRLRDSMPNAEREFVDAIVARMALRPVMAVWIDARGGDAGALAATLRSVAGQAYAQWSLIVAGDADARAAIDAALAGMPAPFAARAQVIPDAAQAAAILALLRPRDIVLPLRAGDRLAVDALFEFAWAAARHPAADFFYADELCRAPATGPREVFLKPDWSPNLLLARNYIGCPWAVTAELLRRTGQPMFAGEPSGNYDRILRCTEKSRSVIHVPQVLCEAGVGSGESTDVERQALAAALGRRRIDAAVEPGLLRHTFRLQPAAACNDLVSIVIATCAARGLIGPCISGLRERTGYTNIEIVCVDNIADPASPWKVWLREHADVVFEIREPFNWSRFNNLAVDKAAGRYLLFLNDDVEVIEAKWLTAMLDAIRTGDCAIVGPQLLYPDRTVQHAGMFLTGGRVGRHAFRFCAESDPGYCGLALTPRDVIAVTGACMLTTREVFFALGRFDEAHAVVNNDLDFCLKAHAANLRCVYTPHAKLIHHEKASRSHLPEAHDAALFDAAWGPLAAAGDPYFHPGLDGNSDFHRVAEERVEAIFPRRPVFRHDRVERILAVKLDHIGDFVSALPALRRLKSLFPMAELTVLAAPASLQLTGLEPAIDATLPFEFFDARSQLGRRDIAGAALEELGATLARRQFDLAVDLRKHTDTRFLLRLAKAGVTAGFDHQGRFPWLDIALAWDGDTACVPKRQLISDDLVNLVDAIGEAGNPDRSIVRRDADWLLRQAPLAARLAATGLFDRRVVCLHAAAGNDNKQWPLRNFAQIADALIAGENVNVALIGGADEAALGARLLAQVRQRSRVHDLTGTLDLALLPYFLDLCALYVGNDSGPKHLAAALGVPTIGVHSGVTDAREFGALGPVAVAFQRKMTCSPCYLLRREDCPRQFTCLDDLPVAPVLAMCRSMLYLGHGAAPGQALSARATIEQEHGRW